MNSRIIYQAGAGVAVIIPAPDCGLTLEEIAAKDVPAGVAFEIIDAAGLPVDRLFRAAWKMQGAAVIEDTAGARQVAHELRRQDRAVKMAPLDIEATIPAKAATAEAAREVIRLQNAALQAEMDAAKNPAELRVKLAGLGR